MLLNLLMYQHHDRDRKRESERVRQICPCQIVCQINKVLPLALFIVKMTSLNFLLSCSFHFILCLKNFLYNFSYIQYLLFSVGRGPRLLCIRQEKDPNVSGRNLKRNLDGPDSQKMVIRLVVKIDYDKPGIHKARYQMSCRSFRKLVISFSAASFR